MDLLTTKILVAVLFFLVRLLFGVLPVKLYGLLRRWEGATAAGGQQQERQEEASSPTFVNQKRHSQVVCAIALCQSFGGGVLFATCFLHMMTEIYKSVEDLKKLGHLDTDYPLSQLTICIGFLFVYFLEEICHWIITKMPPDPCPPVKKKINNFTSSSVTPLDINLEANPDDTSSIEDLKKDVVEEDKKDAISTKSILDIDDNHENIVYDTLELNNQTQREAERASIEEAEIEVKNQQQIMRCVLTDVALSLHAVFEGLAIGLQNKIENIWYLFIAVSIHSATILFCMGLELLLARAKYKFIFLQMLALASASPFGILVAVLVTLKTDMQTRAKSTIFVALEGLSAGTILYITFFEVLNREKERRVYRLQRAVCIIAGFTLMAVLQFLEVKRHPSVQTVENIE